MSDRTPIPDRLRDAALTDESDANLVLRLLRLFGALRAWAYGHWIRSVVIAGAILSLIALTMAGWAYLASLALRSGDVSLDAALRALDDGRYEEARAAVGRMLKSGLLPRSSYGGPLFVLGAVKINDAESQATPDRRRIEYLVASRYLQEARAYGVPAERAARGMLLLGQSLVESGQFEEGLETLKQLIAEEPDNETAVVLEAQRQLATTCLMMPDPQPDAALRYSRAMLANPNLTSEQRASALLHQAEAFSRLGQFEQAREVVAAIPLEPTYRPAVELMQGKIVLDELAPVLEGLAPAERSAAASASAPVFSEALKHLQEAISRDARKGHLTRQAGYYLGRCLQLQGDVNSALQQHARTRQMYPESFEGLASALAEADLLREKDDLEGALLAYRRVLESYKQIVIYRSVVLPLAQLRERLMAALKDFVDRQHYSEALALVEHFPPLFSRTEELELRGGILERAGNFLLAQAPDDRPDRHADRSAGLRKLRAAGLAFEQLAELRFATSFYTNDLWHSAENYFAGHSFTRTVAVLNKYLEHEPELRNAQALLRLGQAHLALANVEQSIAALEECIEFHPLDSSTYQARIDGARAYWHQGDTSRAEQLLRENLTGTSLRPASREWKDSLFELGMLLHETGQYEQAIGTLEEAIERYPQDAQRLVAQYLIGESYRRWAQELLQRTGEARTVSEREKAQQLADARLATALEHLEQVQVSITLTTHDFHSDSLLGLMLRNCYMLEGTVLFDLGRYKDAIEAYSNVASLHPDNPFVLETFVQIANCWRRLGQDVKARGAIQQAQIALEGLPPDADFASATALSREEWGMLLADMSRW